MRAVAFAVVIAARSAQAQDPAGVLEGHVRDAVDSGAVAYAEIRIRDGRSTRSDGLGRYRIADVPAGELEITYRVLGYAPVVLRETLVAGQTLTRDLYLERVPRLLSAMEVRGRNMRVPAGFESVYRRAARGLGSFVTREQIDSLNPRDILEVLHTLPFVRVENIQSGFNHIRSQRCDHFDVLLNGARMPDTASVARILHSTAPSWIQAIEVYDSRARMPVEFLPNCGVIAVWTRAR